MTIYIATSGEYSDYHIDDVFTDREQALIFCATHGCELEEYEADTVKLTTDKPVMEEWHAMFDLNGGLRNADQTRYSFERPSNLYLNAFSNKFFLTAYLPMGIDGEKAEKILCDEFAKLKYQMIEEGQLPWLRK